jgi:hypothetical protein
MMAMMLALSHPVVDAGEEPEDAAGEQREVEVGVVPVRGLTVGCGSGL